jgi:peptide chain release factor 1
MSKELMKKIIDDLTQIETVLSPEQLKNNKKLTFLLAKKKDYEETEILQKEWRELVNQETNQEEKKLLQIEIEKLEKVKEQIIEKVKEQIIEKAEVDKNVIMEIRPGAGGVEAGLFVRDLYRMYTKFAKIKKK